VVAETDVVVIGGGVMGAATARALGSRGREVVLLEQFELGHTRGSSHGTSRIFRFSYHDPTYVGMAKEALPLWRELERESGRELLTTTGGLDLGEALHTHRQALETLGAACELIDGAEVGRRFPFLSIPPAEPVLFQPDAGIVAAEGSVRAFVASAQGHGVDRYRRRGVSSQGGRRHRRGLGPVAPCGGGDGHPHDAVERDRCVLPAPGWGATPEHDRLV
jgi:sarcosine oxidase